MGKISLLDCTLRDGGYVNDWRFGREAIRGIGPRLADSGIEIFEVGFIKGTSYDPDRAVYPDVESITSSIDPKRPELSYVGMVDMSAPVPLSALTPKREDSVDGLRVIFKKDKQLEAYTMCQALIGAGYEVYVQFVGTDQYSEEEWRKACKTFAGLAPYALSIVDSFGLMKRRQFLTYAKIADEVLPEEIALGYHAHNNLQQAFGNAEAFVELELSRDIIIDGSVFGMGRGAGNLNMEIFADFLNEYYDKHYRVEPMLEIMDDYLQDIYKERFWGYSLPLYLSAKNGCHPNYAIYFAVKESLTEKSMSELLRGISPVDKAYFSREKAEQYYRQYQENYMDDSEMLLLLREEWKEKKLLLVAPGRSLQVHGNEIEKMIREEGLTVINVNFTGDRFKPDYIFSSNMRRYVKIEGHTDAKCIITSNMKEAEKYDFKVNFASYSSDAPEIIDNSGVMVLKLLAAAGVRHIRIAGMDGYSGDYAADYCNDKVSYDFSKEADRRNELIRRELGEIGQRMKLEFITPSLYTEKK
jgi:4-hydroxy 2-oxovalerate aldolase